MFTPKKPPFEDATLVATVYNAIDGPMIQDILEGAGIPSLMRPRYGLDALPILAGSSVLGQEIYVDASQAQEARQVIDAFTGGHYQEDSCGTEGEDGLSAEELSGSEAEELSGSEAKGPEEAAP